MSESVKSSQEQLAEFIKTGSILANARADIPASIVVSLVALPLSRPPRLPPQPYASVLTGDYRISRVRRNRGAPQWCRAASLVVDTGDRFK